MFDGKKFMVEVYRRAVPSVDLTDPHIGEGEIRPSDFRIALSEYEKILKEQKIEAGTPEFIACAFFMLNNGPLLIDDSRR